MADRVSLDMAALFGSSVADESGKKAEEIKLPVNKLHEFKDHPFKVTEDDAMEELVESIKENGILVPVIVREDMQEYEIIAGHRRVYAAKKAGLKEVPVTVMDISHDEAVDIMVDTNINRPELLPSEKAKAYKQKYEAAKRQGKHSDDRENASSCSRQIRRYVKLADLSDNLLNLVDDKILTMEIGLNLSCLPEIIQEYVYEVYQERQVLPNKNQSFQMKEMYKANLVHAKEDIENIYNKTTKVVEGKRKVVFNKKLLDRYFDDGFSNEDIEGIITELLEQWKTTKE